jgi:hypothetical protein
MRLLSCLLVSAISAFGSINLPLKANADVLMAESLERVNTQDFDRGGNTPETARQLGWLDVNPSPRTYRDGVTPSDLNDYYRFKLENKSTLTLKLYGMSRRVKVLLINQSGQVLAQTIKSNGVIEDSLMVDLPPGEYYTLVRSIGLGSTYQLALKAQFVATETPASPVGLDVIDPEFDQVGYRVAWQDRKNRLLVAAMNPQTAEILFDQSKLIDTGLAPITSYRDRTGTGNGPEWVYSQEGSQIVYTKLVDRTPYLARTRGQGTQLTGELLAGTDGFGGTTGGAPLGSLDPTDPSPRVLYIYPTPPGPTILAWTDLNQISSKQLKVDPASYGRWVDGKKDSVLLTTIVGEYAQVVRYHLDTDQVEQLSFNPIYKEDVYMWRAPEFNNELVFVAAEYDVVTKGISSLGIYRQGQGQWNRIKGIRPPSGKKFIRSAEPFVYKGKSYMSLLLENDKRNPSEVWIAGIEPGTEFYRQVSDPNVAMTRNDPEPVVTPAGAFIYYADRGSGQIYRANTGLP